ncbi:MAG: glutamate racemase [Parcubacteria group bacterium]
MIGVFDSGLGGLTILKEIQRVLPKYDYLYFGDTMHLPYGNRSRESIYELTRNGCEYLFGQGCDLIILACNTATAQALRKLQCEYLPVVNRALGEKDKKNILGVTRPMAEAAVKRATNKIGVIGTRGTVGSGVYPAEFEKLARDDADSLIPRLKIYQQACPLLVPLIEEGYANRPETKTILKQYLKPLKKAGVDMLILGCTHYPLLLRQIRQFMGATCQVLNPGKIVAGSLRDYLVRHPEVERQVTRGGQRQYLVTDLNNNFQALATRFLGEEIKVRLIK